MLYEEARMALTKERLEDLRKEKKLSFEQLSKQLAERGVNISHTNLKNYEINDPVHPLYGRTRSMSIEYLVAFADFTMCRWSICWDCLTLANRNTTIFLSSWVCAMGRLKN